MSYQNWYETKNHFWIIYEYLSGGDLGVLVSQDKGLPEGMLKVIARMLTDGLRHLHSKETLFYNFKPTNFVFDEYSNLKFVDFSNARLFQDKEEPSGCPAQYLSPEILRKTNLPSVESDLWGLGALLYELASGTALFQGATDEAVYQSVMAQKIPVVSGYSADFMALISGMLAKNAKDRLNWEGVLGHRWNMGPPSVGNISAVYSNPRNKSVEKPKNLSLRQKTTEKPLTPTQLAHSQMNPPPIEDKKFAKFSTMKNLPSEDLRIPKTSSPKSGDVSLYATATTDTTAASKGTKSSVTTAQIGIKKDTTVSALNRNDLLKKPQNPLPVKTSKPESDPKRPKLVKAESLKDNSSVSSLHHTPILIPSKPDISSSRRNMTPSTLKNDNPSSSRNIAGRRMHTKNLSAVALPESMVNDDTSPPTIPSLPFHNFPEKHSVDSGEDKNDDRRKTPDLAKYSRRPKGTFLKKKEFASPLQSLKLQWKNVCKSKEKRLLEVIHLVVRDRDISPIFDNELIQKFDFDIGDSVSLPNHLAQRFETNEDISSYFTTVIALLAEHLPETQKLSVIYNVCRNTCEANIANFIANSDKFDYFVRLLGSTQSRQLKVALTSLFGLVFRHATMLDSNNNERALIELLVKFSSDPLELIRHRALAALGEILFYNSTQSDSTGSKCQALTMCYPVLVRILKTSRDPVTLSYVTKTIENITTKARVSGAIFTTDDVTDILSTLVDFNKDVFLKKTVLKCIDNLLCLNPTELVKVLSKRKFHEKCVAFIFDKDEELSAVSLGLLTHFLLLTDSKSAEYVESFWQKNIKSFVELLTGPLAALKISALLFINALLLRDLPSVQIIFNETAFMANMEKMMREIPVGEDNDSDLTAFNTSLDFFGEISKKLMDFLLANTHNAFKQILAVKSTSTPRARPRTPLTKGRDDHETSLVEGEAPEAVDFYIRLIAQILTSECMMDLLTEENVVAIFKWGEHIGIVKDVCSEETADAIFGLYALLYKDEEKVQRFVSLLSTQVLDDLTASLGKESNSENHFIKFRLIAELILMVLVENFGSVSPAVFLKALKFIADHLNTPNQKINLVSVEVLRACCDYGIIPKGELNAKTLVKDLFAAARQNDQNCFNKNSFRVVSYFLGLDPDLSFEVYTEGLLDVGLNYLSRFADSVTLDEVVECLTAFFQTVHRQSKATMPERMTFDSKTLLGILRFALQFTKESQGATVVPGIYMVYYTLMVTLNIRNSPKIVTDKSLNLTVLDFSPVLRIRGLTNKDLQNKLAKLRKALSV